MSFTALRKKNAAFTHLKNYCICVAWLMYDFVVMVS